MALTPEQRFLRSRMAAHTLHAQGKTNTGPARAAFNARWEREVDPYGVLNAAERSRGAEHARKAHFTGMALKSAGARSHKAA